jgi:hypothetical protein
VATTRGQVYNKGEVHRVRLQEESDEGWLHVCTDVGWETTEAYLPPQVAIEFGKALVNWGQGKMAERK